MLWKRGCVLGLQVCGLGLGLEGCGLGLDSCGLANITDKKPTGLTHKDGKRPDDCTLIPWRGGKPLAWDVTVCTTVADSYLTAASHAAGPSPNKLLIGSV